MCYPLMARWRCPRLREGELPFFAPPLGGSDLLRVCPCLECHVLTGRASQSHCLVPSDAVDTNFDMTFDYYYSTKSSIGGQTTPDTVSCRQ